MIEKQLLKLLCIFSCIVGAILGIIPLVPALTGLAFLLLLFFIAPIVLIYLNKLNIIKGYEMEKCLSIGALAGAISLIGFCLVYFPIAFILQIIFKIQSFIWIKVIFTNIGFLIPMVFFTSIVSAITNAFSAFLVSYFSTYFTHNKK